jgi:pSer/pThr/pTyr-binding forkhead associated (FHA) protein
MFKLVISDDEGKTTVVPLVRDEITIGRQEGNTIRLTERNVSRKHAKLLKANGSFLVEDLRSYNGVKVNGRRIEAQAKLAAGDQISIGDYLLALQLDAQVAPGTEVAGQATAVVANPIPHDAATAMIQAPAHPAPPARIVMLTPPAPGAEFALSKDVIRIGRAEDLDAWVNHRSISREHAEIRHDDNVYTVVDLGSANGVRVNGRDVRNAVLQSGDVIELGQVRFRFVGTGETYVFDADRTVQMDAVEAPAPNRAPIFVGIGIIGLAVVVALLFAVVPGLFGSEEPTVTQLDETHNPHEIETNPLPPVAEHNVPPTMETEAVAATDVAALVSECQAAVFDGRLNDAMSAADRALAAEPGNADAAECRSLVEANRADEETVARAQDQYRAGDLEEAVETIAQLSDGSIFRGQPPVTTIADAWAEQHVEAGRRILGQNPTDAARHARLVLASTIVSDLMRNAAQDLVEDARRREGAVAVAPDQARERQERERAERERAERERETTMEAEPAGDPVQACAAEGFGDPMNRCIVRTVRPVGQRNLRALAMAHRGLGDRGNACRTMRLYVDRYGSTSAANEFRQYIGINCN